MKYEETKKKISRLIKLMEKEKEEFSEKNFNFDTEKVFYEFQNFKEFEHLEINGNKISDIFTNISNKSFNLDFVKSKYEYIIFALKDFLNNQNFSEIQTFNLIAEFISCINEISSFQNYLQMCLCFLSTLRCSNNFGSNIEQTKYLLEQVEKYKSESEKLQEITVSNKIGGFILKYPQFQFDFEILKIFSFITVTKDGYLKWEKKKNTLAKYINYIAETENTDWKTAEDIFQVKGLYPNYKKESSDEEFNKLKELLKEVRNK